MDDKKNKGFEDIKEKIALAKEWVLDNGRIVMPIVLAVCIAITVLIALNANRQDRLQKQAEVAAMEGQSQDASQDSTTHLDTPAYELEENAYPEINAVVKQYYEALAKGDMLTVCTLNSYIDDVTKIRCEEQSRYIESYPEINVYTKPGLTEGTYVVYAVTKTKFYDLEIPIPGMQTYYVGTDESGNYFINPGTYDETVYEYICSVTVQDDVVDLNNKVVAEYNDLVTENIDVSEYIAYLKEKIDEEVGVLLANLETSNNDTTEPDVTEDTPADDTAVVVTKVRAKDVVRIRKSDSENADILGKAQVGQEFTLIQEKPNGWSEIEYEGSSAFIKSEYLEAVQTVTIGDEADTSNDTANDDSAAAEDSSSDKTEVKGKVKVNDNGVRIRKTASLDGEIIDTLYLGTELELIESMSNGWSKVKYKGQYGYVKSEYLEE